MNWPRSCSRPNRPGFISPITAKSGTEENVLIGPASEKPVKSRYLDHDLADVTSRTYLRLNKIRVTRLSRSFLDDIYGILNGVALSPGRAVVPKHLIAGRREVQEVQEVQEVKNLKLLPVPAGLRQNPQPVYPRLQQLFSYARLPQLFYSCLLQSAIATFVAQVPRSLTSIGRPNEAERKVYKLRPSG